jgi:16S rRNA U516 pseudouridylate synthase RsuA-like enzyme
MDEDELNMSIRKFLKRVGISSQREIENAVRSGLASGALSDNTTLKVSVTLRIDSQNSDLVVDGEIKLQ